MFLGGFGIDNFNVNSKWTIGGDGKNMIESDNFYFNSEFNAGMGTFSGGCYGGGKFNWGALIGNVVGGASMIAMALLARGRGGAGAAGLDGIFGAGRCYYGAGGGSYGIGGGSSIFGNGFGGDLYSPTGYTGTINPLNNPNPIHLPGLRFGEAGDGVDGTKKSATDEAGKKGNTADNDGKTPSTDNDNNKGKAPSTDNNNNQGKTPSTDNNNKKPGSTSQGDNNGGDGNGKKQPVSEGNGVPTGAYLKALIDGGKVGNKEYDGNAAGSVGTHGQGVASLKEKDNTDRKSWSDKVDGNPKTTETTKENYKDAVKLGKADGTGDADVSKDGYPTYFTITDYRSHNMYTFEYSRTTEDGKLMYKFSAKESDVSQDDTDKYNGTDWNVNSASNGQEFSVEIVNGEIVLDNKKVFVAHKGK